VQLEAPAAEYVFAAQFPQLAEPRSLLYLPAAHDSHWVPPEVALK